LGVTCEDRERLDAASNAGAAFDAARAVLRARIEVCPRADFSALNERLKPPGKSPRARKALDTTFENTVAIKNMKSEYRKLSKRQRRIRQI